MRHPMLPLLLLPIALAACSATPAEIARAGDRAATDYARLAARLSGYQAEPPQTCLSSIDRRLARGSDAYGSTLLYRLDGQRYVRNDMNGTCPLRNDPILVTQTPSTQLCRGDIVQLVDRGSRFPIGSCVYGDFTTYRRSR